jgi:predicted glycoside hydrolase/deacetylase ChbG (UPF0249 family)
MSNLTELAGIGKSGSDERCLERHLIVNADDFGRSAGVNRGIIEAHEHGIVTSASLMVRWPSATEAAAYSRQHSSLSLGLHFDFAEWVYQDGTWRLQYEVVPLNDVAAVADEASRQLATFRRLVGRNPTHLDSHQHIHRTEPVRSILMVIACALEIPLRSYSWEIRYCGDFYGQTGEGLPFPDGISVPALLDILSKLPSGTTELGCHPGLDGDLDSVYRCERAVEVTSLCDPHVREVLREQNIELKSFHG